MFIHKHIGFFAVAVFCVVILFLFSQEEPPIAVADSRPEKGASSASEDLGKNVSQFEESQASLEESEALTAKSDDRFVHYSDGTSHYLPAIERSEMLYQDTYPERDLRIVAQILQDYRDVFQENPMGSVNYEITSQLLGKNARNMVFLNRASISLSQKEALLDQWGSPFVFRHQSSITMDVISLGPDQQLWTSDDLSLDARDIEDELRF